MNNNGKLTDEQQINFLNALKKLNEVASQEGELDFTEAQRIIRYMSGDCIEPMIFEGKKEEEEVEIKSEEEKTPFIFDIDLNSRIEIEQFLDAINAKKRYFEVRLNEALTDEINRESKLNLIEKEINEAMKFYVNNGSSASTRIIYELAKLKQSLIEKKIQCNYTLTQEEQEFFNNYQSSANNKTI